MLLYLPILSCTTDIFFQERAKEIQRLVSLGKSPNKNVPTQTMASLVSPDAMHKPFDISEIAFNVVGEHCVHSITRIH